MRYQDMLYIHWLCDTSGRKVDITESRVIKLDDSLTEIRGHCVGTAEVHPVNSNGAFSPSVLVARQSSAIVDLQGSVLCIWTRSR